MRRMSTFAGLALCATALIAAGCGSSSKSSTGAYGNYTGSSGPTGAKTGAATGGGGGAAVVSLAKNPKLSEILVNSKGFTLYYFKKDKNGSGKSNCAGACAKVWPPLTTTGKPVAKKGAVSSALGTLKRSDGTTQVTYAGWPLYTYAPDTKPGDIKGNDFTSFGAQWYALHPDGSKAE